MRQRCLTWLFQTLFVVPCAGHALTIDEETSDRVSTSQADGGAPGNISIASGGSITVENKDNVSAVIIDSNNSVQNHGSIVIDDSDNVNGIIVQGARNASIFSNGAISITEDYTREDDDRDDDLDGPLAVGDNRVAIFVNGPLTGNIRLDSSSSIHVEGNDSAAVRIADLQGNFVNDGSINVIGDNAFGIDLEGGASGSFLQSGSVQVQGRGATGVRISEAVHGAFVNEGTVTSIGFADTTVTNYADPESLAEDDVSIEDRIDAEDLFDDGPAVSIGGSLSQGFLNNGIVDQFVDDTEEADETKDTIEDYDENRSTGTIYSYGSGPALVISPSQDSADTSNLRIGTVFESVRDTLDDDEDEDLREAIATFGYDYGIINRATISANGQNVGFNATAVVISGLADGSRKVIVDGGILNTGVIVATAYEANSTAVSIGPYTRVGRISNDGEIEATVSTETNHRATAITIDEHSIVNEIKNTNVIQAVTTATGKGGSAVAVLDRSGSLTSIRNYGVISAELTVDEEDFVSGDTIAIDASHHAADEPVHVFQSRLKPADDVNGDGKVNADDVTDPNITGDILLGAGHDTIDMRAGSITGEVVDFGLGDDALMVRNRAEFSARTFNVENIVIDDATVKLIIDRGLSLNHISVTGGSELTISLELSKQGFPGAVLDVAGDAIFGRNAEIHATLEGFVNEGFDLLLIRADKLRLDLESVQSVLDTPAIYNATVTADEHTVHLTLVPKTALDLGLKFNESSAFDSVLALAFADPSVGAALTSYLDEADLTEDYAQLLPDYSDSTASQLSSQHGLTSGPVGTRLQQIREIERGPWIELDGFGAKQDGTAAGVGYTGYGGSLQLGIDATVLDKLVAGVAISLRDGTNDLEKSSVHKVNWTAYDATLYLSYSFGDFDFLAIGAAGRAESRSSRTVSFGDLDDDYSGEWDSLYFAGSSGLSYQASIGRFFIGPTASLDYFGMSSNGYTEIGEEGETRLALSISDSESDRLDGSYFVNAGWRTGVFDGAESERPVDYRTYSGDDSGSLFRFFGGYRVRLASDPYQASANFVSIPGTSFQVNDVAEQDTAIFFGANMTSLVANRISFTVSYHGELADHFSDHNVHLAASFAY